MTDPSKNEKPLLPHPDPSVTSVNTHFALCLFGVKRYSVTQILIEASTSNTLAFIIDLLNLKRLAVDWSKPKYDPMQVFCCQRTDRAD